MKSPITKLATAAVVVIACLIGLSLWRGTESGIALADVLAQIEKVKSVRWQWSYKVTGGDPNTYKPYNEMRVTWLASQEHGSKSTWESVDPNGEWSQYVERYFLPQKKTWIFIYPTEKIYICQELEDAEVEEMQDNINAGNYLKGILQDKYESLGKSTMDGAEVAGFRITDPNCFINLGKNQQVEHKIWVDVKTLLPVRYDILASAEVDKMVDRLTHHIVMHDFQWDVHVDPAEFEPVIPDDYTRLVVKFPAITEETAIQGLKLSAELLGKYPDLDKFRNFLPVVRSALEKSESPAALRLKEELKGLSEENKTQKLSDATLPIRCLVRFYVKLLQLDNKDPVHYAKTVTPKDVDKVLMRWKVSDSEYRVIYGDLHAETVTQEKLAELEAALPK